MATTGLLVLFVTLAVRACWAEFNTTDYVYWAEQDINAYHLYFPRRGLEMERQTNRMAVDAVQTMANGLTDSMMKVVMYQAQELETAELMMEGTSAQGCIAGISKYMDNAIAEENNKYADCSADALPQLNRIFSNWTKINKVIETAHTRALSGIDNCEHTYPNKDSASRLMACVGTWRNYYFTTVNGISTNIFGSPSMKVFSGTVLPCAQVAVQDIIAKGWKFLGMLVQCAKLSENIDADTYENEIYQEFSQIVTTIDLIAQVVDSQYDSYNQITQIEQEMLHYYDVQKNALEQYVIESRSLYYYASKIQAYLQKYFDTITSTANDNPADAQCTSDAINALNDVIETESKASLKCDENIVNNTKVLLVEVNNFFLSINWELTSVGNVDILSCFTEGYIFADQTIRKCALLKSSGFKVNTTEYNNAIVKDVDILMGFGKSFFGNSSLPCGEITLMKAYLKAERALYDLQRCLYIASGTKYDVTTSQPYYTTTVAPTTTTTAMMN